MMIKDVKSYIHIVGSRLSKAFDIQDFKKEEESEFWMTAAELLSRTEVPLFKDIAAWIDLVLKAPVHFVYRKEGDHLRLFRRQIITPNLRHLSPGRGRSKKKHRQRMREFEGRLSNLEKKIPYGENFKSINTASFTIGRCQYLPLFRQEDFWGIYCVGPYVSLPEKIQSHFTIVTNILSSWLADRHQQHKNRFQLNERLQQEIEEKGEGAARFDTIAHILLTYLLKVTKGSAALLAEEKNLLSILHASNVPEPLLAKIETRSSEFERPFLKNLHAHHPELLEEYGFKSIQYHDFELEHELSGLYLFFGDDEASLPPEDADFSRITNTLAELVAGSSKNRAFVGQLLETYYYMIRQFEKKRRQTYYHTPRLVAFCERFAVLFGLTEEERKQLHKTAKFHDIGYLGAENLSIGAEIKHPLLGRMMLDGLLLPVPVTSGVAAHQEWVNGSGTPLGLKGDEIPRTAKIISIFEFIVEFIEANKDNEDKTESEWQKTLTDELLSRAGKEFDTLMIPTAVDLIQSLGWNETCKLGTNNDHE